MMNRRSLTSALPTALALWMLASPVVAMACCVVNWCQMPAAISAEGVATSTPQAADDGTQSTSSHCDTSAGAQAATHPETGSSAAPERLPTTPAPDNGALPSAPEAVVTHSAAYGSVVHDGSASCCAPAPQISSDTPALASLSAELPAPRAEGTLASPTPEASAPLAPMWIEASAASTATASATAPSLFVLHSALLI